MKTIRFFIIEENPVERGYIKRTINEGIPKDCSLEYNDVDISDFSNEEELSSYLFDEIESRRCNLVLIDYKLEKRDKRFNGNRIFNIVFDRIPLFPLLMLTNMDTDCRSKNELDPNRVYHKKVFFDTLEERSIEMVNNLFIMTSVYEKYLAEADEMERQILNQQERNISEIVKYNNKVNKLLPSANSVLPSEISDKTFFDNLSKNLDKAINYLKKYDKE